MEEGQLKTNTLWPHQPRPGPRHREKWQMFLDQFCVKPQLTLQKQMGQWITPPPLIWHAYYDPSIQTVVIKNENRWLHYRTISKFCRHWTIRKQQPIFDFTPPIDLENIQPLDIIRQNAHQYIVSLPVTVPSQHNLPLPTNWSQYVHSLQQWDQFILKDYHSEVPTIWQEIVKPDQQWDIITNGSFCQNTAVYAWMIHDGTTIISTGKGQ